MSPRRHRPATGGPGAVALLVALLLGAAAAPAVAADWRADVDAFAARVVAAGLAPGLGVAVVAGDGVVHERGFGVADVRTGRGVDEHTFFYIASTTKALTATALALRAARGELSLADPVVRHLPSLEGSAWDRESVTLHDLLTLAHGVRGGGPVVFRTAFSGVHDRATLLALLAGHEADADWRSFRYDNLGYNVLGLVLAADGTSWKDAVASEVLDPLGMERTTAEQALVPRALMAMPHASMDLPPTRLPLAKTDATLHAAGGHWTTAGSLGRFLAAHLSGGRVNGERLLPTAPLRLTQQPHVPQDRRFGPYLRTAWGYGWDIGDWEGRRLLHRFGSFQGYRSHLSFLPDSGFGVVVLANAQRAAVDLVANYAYARLLGADLAPYEALLQAEVERFAAGREAWASERAVRAARQVPLPRPLTAYAGRFHNEGLGTMHWRVVGDGLELRLGVIHDVAEVYDAAADQFRVTPTGNGMVATFRFDDAGRATAVELGGERFARLPDAG